MEKEKIIGVFTLIPGPLFQYENIWYSLWLTSGREEYVCLDQATVRRETPVEVVGFLFKEVERIAR